MTILSSYFSLNDANYLKKSIKDVDTFLSITQKSKTNDLPVFTKKEVSLHVDALKGTMLSLMPYVPDGKIETAHQALKDKSISLKEAKAAVEWLIKNGFLEKSTLDGKTHYKPLNSYIHSHSKGGLQSYIPWVQYSLQVLASPGTFSPSRIQSLTFSFDTDGLSQLSEEYTQFRNKIVALSDATKSDGATFVVYLQNIMYTLAQLSGDHPRSSPPDSSLTSG